MGDGIYVWTPEDAKRLFELKFKHESLFTNKRQPWQEFYQILLENDFPKEMTLDHVRKKWSYTYDCYKLAKRTNNKEWKYFKLFDKQYGKFEVLDKFETWTDEWRLKLVTAVIDAKNQKLSNNIIIWKTVETALRSQDLPIDCCIQDIKALWAHIRVAFARKYRKVQSGSSTDDWPLFEVMLLYCRKYEPDLLRNPITTQKKKLNGSNTFNNSKDVEFQWTKDITESFIQIRLQHDWLCREKKQIWKNLRDIMVEEYGFPTDLTTYVLSKKWANVYSEYQKAKATSNTSWLYYDLFQSYYGDGNFSLNPINGWQDEWVFVLIRARTEFELEFRDPEQGEAKGWRKVEMKLRREGLPIELSLLDISEIWQYLLSTFKWKQKYAKKGVLSEKWPYFDAMSQSMSVCHSTRPLKNAAVKRTKKIPEESAETFFEDHFDDDDDVKLFELKQRLEPKRETVEAGGCRACAGADGCVDLFQTCDERGIDLAHKMWIVCGVMVEKNDNLPKEICMSCLKTLTDAHNFREKCQATDKLYRNNPVLDVKQEFKSTSNNIDKMEEDVKNFEQDYTVSDNDGPSDNDVNAVAKTVKRKKKPKKTRSDYAKVCEICGKHYTNLTAHMDSHDVKKKYSCTICDKKFRYRSGLTLHMAKHADKPRKTCEVCGKTFYVMAQYRRHFAHHANERKYACDTCGKRFNSLDILKVHGRLHNDERPFTCDICFKTFRTAGCVSRHKRIVHKTKAKHKANDCPE